MESNFRRTGASAVALGGVLAAMAVVVMALGTLIPVATYVCPMLCVLLLQVVYLCCGRRVGWAWYACVAILSALMAPDKEAAAIFLTLGYYPLLKPWLDKRRLRWLWKGLLFNAAILLTYLGLIFLLGMEALAAEFSEMGIALCVVLLVMGNLVFFLMDRLLDRKTFRRRKK